MRIASVLVIGALLSGCATHRAMPPPSAAAGFGDMIMVRQTAKTPDQAVEAVKAYTEANKWVYVGATKTKQGEVTLVKVCIPAVAAIVWAVGLETSAMLPCGNVAVYQKAGRTEIAMLDARYMAVLMPHPEVSRASAMAGPLLTLMLDTAAK